MCSYFIDTADISYIEALWKRLSKNDTLYKGFAGITTNPNAMAKVGVKTMAQFDTVLHGLMGFVEKHALDPAAIVYVQLPYDHMPLSEVIIWCNHIRAISSLYPGATVGLKIPPYKRYLDMTDTMWDLQINVTGISDAGTLLRVFSFSPVRYASLIPGRMEEVGIDANSHMANILAARNDVSGKVITGSMRTLIGLQNAISAGTVPTIGTRIFDQMTSSYDIDAFAEMWDVPKMKHQTLAPVTDERNVKLSVDFFTQMNELGQPLYEDFKRINLL